VIEARDQPPSDAHTAIAALSGMRDPPPHGTANPEERLTHDSVTVAAAVLKERERERRHKITTENTMFGAEQTLERKPQP